MKEQGLSEVIGFLMIVALLGILFSMYLVYVVPLQGRESEIALMTTIEQTFIDIKMDIDALIINENTDFYTERVIPLGTSAGTTSGALSIIPMQSFSGSSGILSINDVNRGIMGVSMSVPNVEAIPVAPLPGFIDYPNGDHMVSFTANRLEVRYLTNNLDAFGPAADPPDPEDIITLRTNEWTAVIQPVPHYSVSEEDIEHYLPPTDPVIPGDYWYPQPNIQYDLTISIGKNGNPSVQDFIIARNMANGVPYLVNLYDPAYGLIDSLQHDYQLDILWNNDPDGDPNTPYRENEPISQLVYDPINPVLINPGIPIDLVGPTPITGLEYQSSNKYWINQKYQYEWGTVFREQDTGTSILIRPPIEISEDINNIIHVKIININTESEQEVGGNLKTPLYTKVNSVSSHFNFGAQIVKLPEDMVNAHWIWIQFSHPEIAETNKWLDAFNQIKTSAIKNNPGLRTDIAVIRSNDGINNNVNMIIAEDVIAQLPNLDYTIPQIEAGLLLATPNRLVSSYSHVDYTMMFNSPSI